MKPIIALASRFGPTAPLFIAAGLTTSSGCGALEIDAPPGTEDLESVHIGWCGVAGRRPRGDSGNLPMRVLEIAGEERGVCARGESEVWCWGWL